MKFKNDKQRKAVFANLFNKWTGSKTRVGNSNVRNFETKTVKMKRTKLPKIKTEQIRFTDIKEVKGLKAHCDMCKRKGLSLTKGRCKICVDEAKKFKQPKKRSRIGEVMEYTQEKHNMDITKQWTEEKLKNIRYSDSLTLDELSDYLYDQRMEDQVRIATIMTKRLKIANPKKYKKVLARTDDMKQWLSVIIWDDINAGSMDFLAVEVHNRAVGARDFADFTHDGYMLEDAEQMNFENQNFIIPPARMRHDLQINTLAKLLFKIGTSDTPRNHSVERMWVRVKEKLNENTYLGELENIPFDSGYSFKLFLGAEIVFKPENIIDIDVT